MELKTPQQIANHYRYIKLLGEGSNGKTYLAEALGNGAQVAVKALKLNQSASFKSFELFKREAETLSSIRVRGVPQFYESILSDDIGGECYIIQEYVDAPSIQSYLDAGRIFSERETLWIMRKIADILYSLHTQYSPPIIHRDIKPSNILCRLPEENEGWEGIEPYLIDFGAVANAHSNSDKSTVAGTVGY
ncbi:MAG: protein kinase, partial [Proteobacteria bacterium]|nr:protein kinase [Pseudomonadota bacterium]